MPVLGRRSLPVFFFGPPAYYVQRPNKSLVVKLRHLLLLLVHFIAGFNHSMGISSINAASTSKAVCSSMP